MIYPIVIYGSDVLRKPCERITPDYPEVKKLVEDMFLTLGEAEGVGLAAPQIGKNTCLFIVDCTPGARMIPNARTTNAPLSTPRFMPCRRRRRPTTRDVSRSPASMPTCPARWRSGCVIWTRISSSTTKSSTAEGLGHPARIRPHRGHRLHRPDFAPAPQPAERKADEPGKGQIPLRV